MKKALFAALAATMLSGAAFADTMVVNRGLPTTNLNNSSGANQSNVAWADADGGFYGDSFKLGGDSATQYTINTIRTWVAYDGTPTSATLFTGLGATSDLADSGATAVFTLTSYANSESYQRASGGFLSLYQVDFTGLNIVATGGSTISFGVNGAAPQGSYWFNHASNAGLSGSPQDGSDGLLAYYTGAGNFVDLEDSNQANFWNKSSDINVQVFADVAALPEPATWAMMVGGFGMIGFAMRRRQRTSVTFA